MATELAKKRGRPRKVDVEDSKMPAASEKTAVIGESAARKKADPLEAKTKVSKTTTTKTTPKKSVSMPPAPSRTSSAATGPPQAGVLKALEEQGASRPFTASKAVKPASQNASTSPLASPRPDLRGASPSTSHTRAKTSPLSPSRPGGMAKTDAAVLKAPSAGQRMASAPISPPIKGETSPPAALFSQTFSPTAALLKDKSPAKSSISRTGSSQTSKAQPNATPARTSSATLKATPATKAPPIPASKAPSSPQQREPAKPVNPSQTMKKPMVPPSPSEILTKERKAAPPTIRDPMRPTLSSLPREAPPSGSESSVARRGLPGTYKQNSRRITLIIVALPICIVMPYFLYERVVNGVEPRKLPAALTEAWDRKKAVPFTKDNE